MNLAADFSSYFPQMMDSAKTFCYHRADPCNSTCATVVYILKYLYNNSETATFLFTADKD